MARDMNPDTPEVSEIALLTDIGQAKNARDRLKAALCQHR